MSATKVFALCGTTFDRAASSLFAAKRNPAAALDERQQLLGMLNLAAIMVRDIDGTIRFWSEGCQHLFGWTSEQAVGQSSHDLLQTVFPFPLADINSALLRHGEWNGTLRHRAMDGSGLMVSVRKVLRRDPAGDGCAVIENVADVTAQRRTEGDLRDSQAELQSVVDTAAEGILVAQMDGRIVSINRAGVRLFGYDSADELIGSDVGVLMPRAESARHGAYVAAHRAGAPPRIIGVPGRALFAVRRDGTEFPIELSVSSFSTDRGRYLTGIIRDITVRSRAEAGLRDSEARLRLVQQVGGIAYTDQTHPNPVVLVSDEFTRLYGLPMAQPHILETDWHALVHPADVDRFRHDMRVVSESGGSVVSEFRIRRTDGSIRWIVMRAEAFLEKDGRLRRVISAQRDITEIVAAREALASRQEDLERRVVERTAALAAAEARFRGIFDSQSQFVGLLTPTGTILEANQTALQDAGLARNEVVGRSLWGTGLWTAVEHDQMRQDIIEAARGTRVRRNVETRSADGRSIWTTFSLAPVRDPATGVVMWIIAEANDFTEMHDLAGQLAQAQKVQALGELAGGIAHDFNNILQTILGSLALIDRHADDPEKVRRRARVATDAATRGASVTERLLSFAHRGNVRTDVIATAELIHGIREVLAHTLGGAITVCVSMPPSVPPLLASRGLLETALVNLATNARDAMPDGGTLTLSAQADPCSGGNQYPVDLAEGEYVRLSVADTGVGMDPATLARATEPFFTSKPPGQGTGLGLSMVKGFVEQSGGAVSIASSIGAGTTVVFWLPQAMDDVPRIHHDKDEDLAVISAQSHILLVDDDDLVRETLAAQLGDMGFAVVLAASGTEALALLETGEVVDAMVTDLSMPGMDGITTIHRARALRPELPCFLLTGYVGDGITLAADDVFTLVRKPIDARTLAAQIEATLEILRLSRNNPMR